MLTPEPYLLQLSAEWYEITKFNCPNLFQNVAPKALLCTYRKYFENKSYLFLKTREGKRETQCMQRMISFSSFGIS